MSTPAQRERYLHGEIVAFGVLCLLTYDGQIEECDCTMSFNKSIVLPVTLGELEITQDDLIKIADEAARIFK